VSGAGISHRVNGIIVQITSSSCIPLREVPTVKKKDKQSSLEPHKQHLPAYISAKREGPPPLKSLNLSMSVTSADIRTHQSNCLWVITRLHDFLKQTTISGTGFNIQTKDQTTASADNIGYLPTINAPATRVFNCAGNSLSIGLDPAAFTT
jgi:hypothetical protein